MATPDSLLVILPCFYRKRGNICWAKHSRFQPYEVILGNTFVVPLPAVFIFPLRCPTRDLQGGRGLYYLTIAKYSRRDSRENFRGTLKNRESLVQRIFPRLRYNIY